MRNDSSVEDGVDTLHHKRYAVQISAKGTLKVNSVPDASNSQNSDSRGRLFAIKASNVDELARPNGKDSKFGPGDVLDVELDRAQVRIVGSGYAIRALSGVGVVIYEGARPRIPRQLEDACPRIALLPRSPF